MSLTYFAYGSNLNLGDMRARCPDAIPEAPARLDGWRLTFRGVADIERAPERSVHGALWLLTDEDAHGLDRYEGAPTNYRRQAITVGTDDGLRDAMTYVMTERTYLGLPSAWYFGRIEAGFEDWDLPVAELRRALRETEADLADAGIATFHPDGRKRLRAVRTPS